MKLIKSNRAIAILVCAFVANFCLTANAQSRVISLEVSTPDRAELTTQQRWMEMLSEVGADSVRSRTSRGAPRPGIEEMQLGKTVSVRITGVISGRQILLPGATFGIKDKQGVRDYIQKIRDDGSKVALAEKKAFGLTSEQLVGIGQEFMAVVGSSTKGVATSACVEEMINQLTSPVKFDETARRALASGTTVRDELRGLSVGTALSAAVRPLGLIIVPKREQGKMVEIQIVDSQSSKENWPVGWPIEKPLDQVAPKLFNKLNNVEIRGFALKSILDRFETRMEVPFIYDQNTLARNGIELETTKVTLVKKKTTYMVALSRMLAQSKPMMKQELRVDENGKPFLWISVPK